MEQPELSTPADTPIAVPPPTADRAADLAEVESSQSNRLDPLSKVSNSVPSLRFPRPLGNRQLTNWISSSSPAIMQPENNIIDDDPNLAELGYDVIGTDGESQAESTASSFDYQRPDDVQSLAGTDTGTDVDTNEADSDSSDDDEGEDAATLNNTAAASIISSTVVEYDGQSGGEDDDIESPANQSLENPTDVSQHGLPRLIPEDRDLTWKATADLQQRSSHDNGPNEEKTAVSLPPPSYDLRDTVLESYHVALGYIRRNRRIIGALSGLALLYSLAIVGKYFVFTPPAPKVISTVPVAAVSSAAVPSPVGTSLSISAPTSTWVPAQTHNALQTGNPSNSLAFMTFGRERTQTSLIPLAQPQTICSAELYDRNEIVVKIPLDIKSTWLARDAILIAVSRGLYDIPTKVSSVDEGFLIEVPQGEAHGILAISIATTRKPKVQETFHVNFGRSKFTGALDAGKQLVRGFAQKFVDTVNETTAWVEETYIPALDVMSKQVCIQTSSVSGSLLQAFREASNAALDLPTRLTSQLTAHIKQSLDRDSLAHRHRQTRLQLTREAQDLGDELALRYLSAQLSSKLWWLRIQGKTEEYQRYLSKAEAYLREKVADAKAARLERAEHVKKQIRSQQTHERRETRSSFWGKARA
ncbi:hypothetical protein GGS23DRAFT_226821 [Durotheca rogersii]|uniref:uncharacterized protein n=1 Tax=Durotheca rogersii TaxID=419775 RepID=UPI002220F31C|nr:uncharacterized protein GGS23DRAFT_226821 [Durotheca rogersii]KAI5860508.1 hypothetical protein GGS23DRAFT_226821 [Durotheca rogersii]